MQYAVELLQCGKHPGGKLGSQVFFQPVDALEANLSTSLNDVAAD